MEYLLREIKRSSENRRKAKAYFDSLRTKKRRARPEGSDFALMQKQRYVLALRDHAVKVLSESRCRNPLAEASHQVAEHLRKNGYKGLTERQVYTLKRRISPHGYRK
jgi:hypothetical protein